MTIVQSRRTEKKPTHYFRLNIFSIDLNVAFSFALVIFLFFPFFAGNGCKGGAAPARFLQQKKILVVKNRVLGKKFPFFFGIFFSLGLWGDKKKLPKSNFWNFEKHSLKKDWIIAQKKAEILPSKIKVSPPKNLGASPSRGEISREHGAPCSGEQFEKGRRRRPRRTISACRRHARRTILGRAPQAPSLAQGTSSAKKIGPWGLLFYWKCHQFFSHLWRTKYSPNFLKDWKYFPKFSACGAPNIPKFLKTQNPFQKFFSPAAHQYPPAPPPKKKQLSQIFFSIENWENNFNPRWNFAN